MSQRPTHHHEASLIVRWGIVLIALFVLYQTWGRPTYQPPPPSAPTQVDTLVVSTPLIPGRTTTDELTEAGLPQTRLVNLSRAPNGSLNMIRSELEKGDYIKAEAGLRKLPRKALDKERERRYVAALWNNLGVQQEKFGGIEVSVEAFKNAVALDPGNPIAHLNLTQAYWGLRDPALTRQFLQKVIRLAPHDPFPHLALADLLIDKGDVTLASRHLEDVAVRASTDPDLQTYSDRLLAKIHVLSPQGEHQMVVTDVSPKPAEQDMEFSLSAGIDPARPPAHGAIIPSVKAALAAQQPTQEPRTLDIAHFTVVFDGGEDQATWTRMRAILEYAYQEIGQKFGYTPAAPIKVVLHMNQKFAEQTGTPAWADALFDQTSGTIHIPAREALDDLAWFSRVVRHELVHALLHEKMNTRVSATPTWLVEGLAIQLAEDPWSDLDEMRKTNLPFLPLASLQGRWTEMPGDSLPMAYFEADVATRSLTERFGLYGIRQILNLIRTGQSFGAAMQAKLALSYDTFQDQWAERMRADQKSRKS